jgi:hypothetical protein
MVALPQSFNQDIAERINEACARKAAAEPPRNYLGMSELGHPCLRKLWLSANGAPRMPTSGRSWRTFRQGHDTEARVKEDLRAAGYVITGEQLEFSDFNYRVKGHCDGIIHGVTQEPHILEIKSANRDSFKEFASKGMRKSAIYEAQVHLYMGYSGLSRALFIVYCKDNPDIYTERAHFRQDIFEATRARAAYVLGQRRAPAKDETLCGWCDYGHVCESHDIRDDATA